MFAYLQTAALASSIVLLGACSSDDPTPTQSETLIWHSCTDSENLQCAELKVPRNYNDETSGDINIGINRLPASIQPARGSILLNPGGPGGSGTDLISVFEDIDTVPDSIREVFDLVGFDPRGIGESDSVDCTEFGIDDTEVYLTDGPAIVEFLAESEHIAQECFEKYDDYLQQLGSLNVVRDMESIRIALNEEKLNFIAYSYGTRLAALYLQTYPEVSGAIVLDASMSPNSELLTLAEEALPALQGNIEHILAQCTRVASDCDPGNLLQRLITKANTLVANNSLEEFDLLGSLVLMGTQNPDFGDFLVAPLVNYLLTDDISVLQQFSQFIEEHFGDLDRDDDSTTAQLAILCADDPTRPTADALTASLQQFNTLSDLFAEAQISQAAMCAGWPESLEPLETIATSNAPASLVIGGTSDAQTPLHWSQEMATAIGGHFLSSDHPGHSVVFTGQSPCVDSLVTQFFLDAQLPMVDTCSTAND